MLAGDARHPGIEMQGATTGSEIAVSSGEAGSSWPRAGGTTGSAGREADGKSVAGARPREKLGVCLRARARVNTRLLKARVRSGSGVMLPRPLGQ